MKQGFYTEKNVKERAAYPKAIMKSIMIEEVLERLRSCSPEMATEKK